MLQHAAHAGDPEAWVMLGLWKIEGRQLPRDLAGARAALAVAADAGHAAAARILAGMVATGNGGPADWAGSLGLLDAWAVRDPMAVRQCALIAAMDLDPHGDPQHPPEGETLCSTPFVRRFDRLFTPDECAFLIDASAPRFRPATIFHDGQQRFVRDPLRDSDNAGFPVVAEWPAIHALNRRLAAASGTDVAQGEPLQLIRYGPGQQYRPHLDAIAGLANQRVLTILVYLNEDYDGGETHFAESGLSVRGRTGDALLFVNALPDGRPDPATRHAGLPVRSGVKVIASRWIRQRPAGPEGFGAAEVARH